jgi:microcystin-dependent protein
MYNAMFNRVGKQYGEKAHKLLDEEMPVHTHIQNAHGHTQTDHTHTSAAHYHTINHDHGNAGTGGVTANHRHSTAYYPLSSPRAYGANESNTGYNVGGGFAWATSGWIDTDHAHYLDMPNFTGNSGTTTPAATGGAQAVLQDKIATNQNAGGDQPHSNMQRSRATYYIIKAQ